MENRYPIITIKYLYQTKTIKTKPIIYFIISVPKLMSVQLRFV